MKKFFAVCVYLAMCLCLLISCGKSDDSKSSDKTFSEGVDTKCEVTAYTDYDGGYKSMFLKKGDKIAVIAPSALPSKEQTKATLDGLEKWGYVPVKGKYVSCKERTMDNCMEDLNWALNDKSIKAIYCVRGGYGSSEVMDAMPAKLVELIASSKKLLIGFSDITVYHSAWTVADLPSVQASMSAAFMDLPKECADVEKNILKGRIPAYKCEGSKYDKQGQAEGLLIGGNLSTFTSVVNTAYDCSKDNKNYVLFFEEVESNYENVHRYLTWLKHAGVLDKASGIIFGEWSDMKEYCETYTGNSRGGQFKSFADMISRQFLKDLDIPVAFGFPAGHGERNFPLLMGAPVKLDVGEDSFTLQLSK